MPVDKQAIVEKRKYFLAHSRKTTLIRKGDKRVVSATRFCAVCKRPLSKLMVRNGKTIATVTHHSCQLSDMLRVNLCADIHSCYNYIRRTQND